MKINIQKIIIIIIIERQRKTKTKREHNVSLKLKYSYISNKNNKDLKKYSISADVDHHSPECRKLKINLLTLRDENLIHTLCKYSFTIALLLSQKILLHF